MKRILFSTANALHNLADKVAGSATKIESTKCDRESQLKNHKPALNFITYYNDMPVAAIKGI